jgi:HSP20 family protein
MAVTQTGVVSTGQKQSGQQSGQPAGQDESRRRETEMVRTSAFPFASPFALLQRFFTDDVMNLFDELDGRPGNAGQLRRPLAAAIAWAPKIDVVQRANELVVRADLPGVNPDDVTVEVNDDAMTISGERRQEHSEEHGSVYRFERSYGTFFRQIPLPKGAIANQARANFKDGVLEISVPAPSEQVTRGRRIEISRGDAAKQSGSERKHEGA